MINDDGFDAINTTMPDELFFDVAPVDVEQPGVWYVASTERGFVTEPIQYTRADGCQGKAFNDVISERRKQIAKGYDAEHDDLDYQGRHARAAAYYATAAYYQRDWDDGLGVEHRIGDVTRQADVDSVGYPWNGVTKKVEQSARENLVKAAALIIAEIERIDRESENTDD